MRRAIAMLVVVLGAAGAVLAVLGGLDRADTVILSSAKVAPIQDRAGFAQLFLTIENPGPPDVLLSAQSPEARAVVITEASGPLAIPASSAPSLAADGAHLVLTWIEGPLDERRLIPITLTFRRSGQVSTRARIGAEADPHAQLLAQAGLEVADSPPGLALSVEGLTKGRWRVTAETENFTFTEPVTDPAHVPGEGHGHLYLNGLKLQRMYGRDAEIGALPPGQHQVSVSLNTNTHRAYWDAQGPVQATAEIRAK